MCDTVCEDLSIDEPGSQGASAHQRMSDSLAAPSQQEQPTASLDESAAVLQRTPGAAEGLESLPFWFHQIHGLEASSLAPFEDSWEDSTCSAAQAFVDRFNDQSPAMQGVLCHLSGSQRQLETAEASDDGTPFAVPLMFADVSCSICPATSEPAPMPEMLLFAVIPSAGEMLVGGEKVQEKSRAVWYLLSKDVELRSDILDIFSLCGCLRQDLHEAYKPSVPDQIILIGEGAYAKVHAMAHRTGQTMAVKKINATVLPKSIFNEISTHLDVHDHAHIVGFRGLFYGYEKEDLRLSAVFDLATHGDLLFRVMRFNAGMGEVTARPLFQGILSALSYIHEHQIVHRDVKAENVLLMAHTHAVVADFGLAVRMSDATEMARRCGSPGYVAPEVCLGQPYGAKVDTFSAGVVLYFMLSKEMPFSSPDHDTARTMQRTVKCSLHLQKPPWNLMTSRLRNMLRSLICKNQTQRQSSQEALQHSWLSVPEPVMEPPPQNIAPQGTMATIEETAHLADMGFSGPEALAGGYPVSCRPPNLSAAVSSQPPVAPSHTGHMGNTSRMGHSMHAGPADHAGHAGHAGHMGHPGHAGQPGHHAGTTGPPAGQPYPVGLIAPRAMGNPGGPAGYTPDFATGHRY